MEDLLKLLGEIVAYGGGAAVVAYGVFQFLGKSWIESKFAQQLAKSQHDHDRQLQHLRVRIDSILSGALKLQNKEFELLPELWNKLDDTFSVLGWVSAPLQHMPDLDGLTGEQLNEFLDSTELSSSQKTEVRDAQFKAVKYQKLIFWYRLHKVKATYGEYQAFIARNTIFFEASFLEKLKALEQLLWEAIVAIEVGEDSKDYKMKNSGWKKLKEEGEHIKREIGEYIRERLLSHANAETGF